VRKRLALLGLCTALAGVVVAAGLGVRELTGGAFAEHAGTVLYATLMYLLVCLALLACLIVLTCLKITTIAVGLGPIALGRVTVAACWLVELYQLTGVPARLAAHSTLSRLALGAAFQPLDLFWYVVGAVIAVGLHWTGSRLCARRLGSLTTRPSGTDVVGPQGEAVPLGAKAATAPPDSAAAR